MEWSKQQHCASINFSLIDLIHVTAGKDACACRLLYRIQLHTDKLVLVIEQEILLQA